MRKQFSVILTVLLGLFAGVNTMWADMTPGQAATNAYWAKMILKPSSVGVGTGGQVYASTENVPYADVTAWASESVAEGYTESYVELGTSSFVPFYAYARANDGSYLLGWSYAEGGSDLYDAVDEREAMKREFSLRACAQQGKTKALEYTIFASFAPIRIESCSMISGSITPTDDGSGNWKCTQVYRFVARAGEAGGLGEMGDIRHFYQPSIQKKNGTAGEWSVNTLIAEDVTERNVLFYGSEATLDVTVTFIAPNGNPADYAATLTLSTKAGVQLNVPVVARIADPGAAQAGLYRNKVLVNSGDLTDMIEVAGATDVVKLNKNYETDLAVNKDLILDLNGYELAGGMFSNQKTFTINGGHVTIAHSNFGGKINQKIALNAGKLTLNGGDFESSTYRSITVASGAELEQNGATVAIAVNNAGTMTVTDGTFSKKITSSGTLVVNGGSFTNTSGAAIEVTGGTAQIKKGTLSGSTYGVEVTGGSATIEKLAVVSGDTKALKNAGGSLTVNNGKFVDPAVLAEGTITFVSGYFQKNESAAASVDGKPVWNNTAGSDARDGYVFFAGTQEAAQASGITFCRINTTAYSSLEDALAYANNNPQKSVMIFMENDYTLPAGYYTLPANATLVVPRKKGQESAYPTIEKIIIKKSLTNPNPQYPTPTLFRRLTLASGVNLEILGTLEVSGAQCCISGKPEQSLPADSCGHMVLNPGSHITVNNGGELRVWGYVTGDGSQEGNGSGEIDARRGSVVRELFQMGDWKGGSDAVRLLNLSDEIHLFPIYEYFIQSIESPVKYHPGSSLLCATAVVVSGDLCAFTNNIRLVGKNGETAMFLMDEKADAENTWVRKWYDVKNDQQVYEVNSGAQLGSLLIDLGSLPSAVELDGEMVDKIAMNSGKFVLPLTHNMKIHLLSGTMEFTQSTACLPGMEVEIDKESTISIVKNSDNKIVSGGLYFYDADQWGPFAHPARYAATVFYSATLQAKPAVRDVSSAAALGDAKMLVHGTFRVAEGCAVYTTAPMEGTIRKDSEANAKDDLADNTKFYPAAGGGACITSTNEDAGTFVYEYGATPFEGINFDAQGVMNAGKNALFHYTRSTVDPYKPLPLDAEDMRNYDVNVCSSARLQNKEGHTPAYTETALAGEHDAYCFTNDQWRIFKVDEDNECFMVDKTIPTAPVYYAKPAGYVAISATKENGKFVGNDDHTFSDAAGEGHLYILIKEDCQWWEVVKEDNLYHCIHPNNDTYYYWNGTKWVEKTFTVTWRNWDGTIIQTTDGYGELTDSYVVTYGTMAEFLGSTPTREPSVDYTYDFTGWSPALGPVKSDVTYTATYVQKERKYTVVFLNEGGVEIERHFLKHNDVPVCENVPTRPGYLLEWSPAIAAVTGDATYTATWLEEPPTEYAVTFFDYDGITKLKPTGAAPYMVAVGQMPEAPENPSGKPATDEFTYVFDHWSPALEAVSATSIKSYTAVYREEEKTYEIKFYKEDGTTLITTQNLPYGATPTPPTVSKENPDPNYTYTLEWKNIDDGSDIQTVMGNASYKPTYKAEENRYTRYAVILSATIPEGCTLIGAGTYDDGALVAVKAIVAENYEFVEWQKAGVQYSTAADLGIVTITENLTLTAIVKSTITPPTPPVEEDLEIAAGQTVTLDEPITKQNLIITSDGLTSGQLVNADLLQLTGEAYFDLSAGMQANTWYTVAVPWQVDATDGIYINGVTKPLGAGVSIYVYDGATRAANGKGDNWRALGYNGDNTLYPGTLYMMSLSQNAATVRFQKKAGEAISTTSLSVEAHPQTTGSEADAGWNGIANPALYYAYIDATANTYSQANFGQKYIPNELRYDAVNMASAPMIVGEPIFVQVAADKDITVVTSNPFSAPVRRSIVDNSYYEVRIAAEADYTDRLYLQTMEDKEDRYVIGLDLAKAGVSTQVAQMWVNRYNTKLCVNTTAPVGSSATYPLGIYAPKDGEYQIYSATEMQDGQEMYVTVNGRAIWNLAYGPYTVSLAAGTHNQYGLKLVQCAPAVSTGVEAISDQQSAIRKVLIDGQVYVIREGEVYSIDGQKVQ